IKGEKRPTPQENEPREPALEYLLKDITEKELKDSHPGLITRIFGGKEKRAEQDFNPYHVLAKFLSEEAQPNAVGPGVGPVPGPGGFGGGANNLDAYFQAWDLNKVEGVGFPGVGPGPGPGLGREGPKVPRPPIKGKEIGVGPGPGGPGVALEKFP